jgi:hypothetical protein
MPDNSQHEVIRPASLLDPALLSINQKDRELLIELAEVYHRFANDPIEIEKQTLQRRKNNLDWVRPLVICFPEISWREIIRDEDLLCEGQIARGWERQLRQLIFTAETGSDECLPGSFNLGYVHGGLEWGIGMQQIGDLHAGSYRWEAPIQKPDDIEKMNLPIMEVDFAGSDDLLALAEDVFSVVLPVKRKEAWFWTTGLTQTFIYLRGLEQMMFDMMDNPAFVHALMALLSDGTGMFLDELQTKGLLFPNWDIAYCGSGGLGVTDALPQQDYAGIVRLCDQWGFSESQETVGVSPRMFAEFILPYQKPLMEKFGLTYYGCCEPVDQRWKYLREIPNLRRISVSPWSDRQKMADFLGQEYVFCLKPNPAFLAFDHFPEEEIRQYVQETLAIAGECHLEFILKDVTTVRQQPARIKRWVRIVKEEILG